MMRLAVDFGARFADLCLVAEGAWQVTKQPLEGGPVAALTEGLAAFGVTAAELDEIRVATTRPLNRLLAQEVAPIALICTKGFGDVLELGRQDRVDLYAPVARSAAPLFLATRDRIHEIGGRIGADGAEVAPLDTDALRRLAATLRAGGVSAVAVSLLFGHLNPAHEQAVAQTLAAALPGIPVSLSHRIDPAPREYERSVATLLDAWMRVTALPELDTIAAALRVAGFAGALRLGDGRGVVRDWDRGRDDPLSVLASGPAAAARGALAPSQGAETVVLDLGSRSADLMLLRDDAPAMADPGRIGGIPLRRDLVDVHSVALGGSCRVAIADGRLCLDAPDAERLDTVLARAGRLPGGPGAVAAGLDADILAAVAARLAEETIRFATRRNVDPARAGLVISGGTGGLLAAEIAQATGLSRLLLADQPAAAGATGLAAAPERIETTRAANRPLPELDAGELAALFDALDAAFDGGGPDLYRLALAPRPEMHPMSLTLTERPGSPEALRAAYRDSYAARYDIDPPGPGHLGHAAALRDRLPAPAGPPPAPDAADGPHLHRTPAGAIWVPAGWRLAPAPGGYLLERMS